MNPSRALMILMILALPALVLSGCGGSGERSHDVPTTFDGTVLGVVTDPANAEESVDTDVTIRVSWPDPDYPPPASFTFRLDRDDGPYSWQAVYTEMHSDTENRVWTFDPSTILETGKWHRATITDDLGQKQYVFFRTYGTPETASTRSLSTAQPKGAVEHTVRTR